MEQVVSSIPASVGYISHGHWAYDYLGPFKFSGYIWLDTKNVLKINMEWPLFLKSWEYAPDVQILNDVHTPSKHITLSSFQTPLTLKVTSGASTIACYTKYSPQTSHGSMHWHVWQPSLSNANPDGQNVEHLTWGQTAWEQTKWKQKLQNYKNFMYGSKTEILVFEK